MDSVQNNFWNNMKGIVRQRVVVIVSCITLFGCEIDDNIKLSERENIRESNNQRLAWEVFLDSMYTIAETDLLKSTKLIDRKTIEVSNDQRKLADLFFLKGYIYYKYDSVQQSVEILNKCLSQNTLRSPKCLAARAGSYIKLEKYDLAYEDLLEASQINYDYLWNLGNYFEIIGEKYKANSYYNMLYQKDTIAYKYCFVRMKELRQEDVELLTELSFKDRGRLILQFY